MLLLPGSVVRAATEERNSYSTTGKIGFIGFLGVLGFRFIGPESSIKSKPLSKRPWLQLHAPARQSWSRLGPLRPAAQNPHGMGHGCFAKLADVSLRFCLGFAHSRSRSDDGRSDDAPNKNSLDESEHKAPEAEKPLL